MGRVECLVLLVFSLPAVAGAEPPLAEAAARAAQVRLENARNEAASAARALRLAE